MGERRIVITQGQQEASSDPDLVLTTLLGSCVSVCLWDPLAKAGGLNHILLPSQKSASTQADLAGLNAIELLINAVLKEGAMRERLIAKVFGGARMVAGLSDIGDANADFVVRVLEREGIDVAGKSLGGSSARNLMFWPSTGVARLKLVAGDVPVVPEKVVAPAGNDLELF